MNTLISLSLRGDGTRRLEEHVAEALQSLRTHSEIHAAFRSHPNLYSVTPEEIFGKISRGRSNRLIESGFLSDNELVGDALFGRGKTLEIALPLAILMAALDLYPPVPSSALPPAEILTENEDFLALSKPSDLASAPLHSDEPDSAVHRALLSSPRMPVLRANPLEPGLVHRLDTGTSGVLLFVKSPEAFARISGVWNSGKVKKEYRAITESTGSLKLGRVELWLGHDAKSKRRMRAVVDPRDQKAIRGEPTRSVSEIKSIRELDGGRRFEIQVTIETGVHHQIRATLAHFGAPILGDSVYNNRTAKTLSGVPENRLWLHAYRLILPADLSATAGKSLEIVAPLPPSWLTG